jgi:hypothetical protein
MSESPESNTPPKASLQDFFTRLSHLREELEADILPQILLSRVPPKKWLTQEGCRIWYRIELVARFRVDSLAFFSVVGPQTWNDDDADFLVILLHLLAEFHLRYARRLVDLSDLIWPASTDKRIWLYEVEAELVGSRDFMTR